MGLYSCPKCDVRYCSLDCYKSVTHLDCSETFYKENIIEELKLQEGVKDNEAKMLEILKRLHEDSAIPSNIENEEADTLLEQTSDLDSDDDPEQLDISERLAGVNLNDAEQIWDKLTEDERQDFVSFLKYC